MNRLVYTQVIVIVVILVALTWFIPANWIPPTQPHMIPFGLNYPNPVGYSGNETEFLISMMIAYNGSIAENTPILVANSTCQLASWSDAWIVEVGFSQALPWNFKDLFQHGGSWIGGLAGALFIKDFRSGSPLRQTPTNGTLIYFPIAGDYSPSLYVLYWNGSETFHTFEQMKIHVLSESEINAENISRNNLILTIALLGFSYIEGITIIAELMSKRKKKSQLGKTEPNNVNIPSTTNKTPSSTAAPNSSEKKHYGPLVASPKNSSVNESEDSTKKRAPKSN
jgi:hypothetical protein